MKDAKKLSLNAHPSARARPALRSGMGKPIYYASGTNKPGEIRGMAQAGRDLGVAADKCRDCLPALEEIAKKYPKILVFIDSGAFSEVSANPKVQAKAGLEPQPGVLLPVAPITKAEWSKRLQLMLRAGRALGSRLLIMAPDRVGDQDETLRRLEWFKSSGWLAKLRKTGMEIAVVLQGGKLDPIAYQRKVRKALGWAGYSVAFPMAKAWTPIPLIAAYIQSEHPGRVHLLGIGPKARREEGRPSAADVRTQLFDRFPRVAWSWDTALIRQSVGRTKGREALYTWAQDIERQKMHAEALAGRISFDRDGITYDWTEMQTQPSLFLLDLWRWPRANKCVVESQAMGRRADTPAGRKQWRARKAKWDKCRTDFEARARVTAEAAGLKGAEAKAFIDDPDGFTTGRTDPSENYDSANPRIVYDPVFVNGLAAAFDSWIRESTRLRKLPQFSQLLAERAAYLAFREGGARYMADVRAMLNPEPPGGQRGLPGFDG